MPPSILDAVHVVLFEPQKPVNIAATVRAMKNMGVASLRLVRPVAYEPNAIEVVAHDTRDIVERIGHFDTLDEALADCVRVAGFSGKRRAAKWPLLDPRAAAEDLLGHAAAGPVALLFGREDDGLPREALDRAHVLVTIPTTEYASLNLAQAALVALYELHRAAADATRRLEPPRKHAPLPRSEELEQFYGDAERSLAALDFFRTRNSEHVMRSVRSLVFRARPDARELQLLRSMAFEVLRTIDRVRRDAVGEATGSAARAGDGSPADAPAQDPA